MKKNILFVLVGVVLGVVLSRASDLTAGSVFSGSNTQPISALPAGPSAFPSFAELAKKVQPAVVNVSTTKVIKRQQVAPFRQFGQQDPFEDFFNKFFEGGPREQHQNSLGSGFVINKEGYILTNNHVVAQADEIMVTLVDGRKFKSTVVGTDPQSDLAVIKIKAPGDVPFVPLGDSDKVEPGEWAMAIGNPFGFSHTVTVGVISAKGRLVEGGSFGKFLQTDASINPGNSGGPLFNTSGEVIGINSMIYGMGTGIGFAIPINLAKELLPQLIAKGSVTRGWLGVAVQKVTPDLAKSFNLENEEGALIADVYPGSPADKAGLKRGDIVSLYNDKKIAEPFDLTAYVGQTAVGKSAQLKVIRAGKAMTLAVTVGKREEEKLAAKGGKGKSEEEDQGASDLLGLLVRNLRLDEQKDLGLSESGGVVIQRVDPNSPAEQSDVHEGDVLLEINGEADKDVGTHQLLTQKLKKGSIVRLLLHRESATIYVAFTL